VPTPVSITARAAFQAAQMDDVAVMLAIISHPTLSAPIFLSSDPTERLSLDPLVYGTRHQGSDYPFVLMSAVLPDDQDKSPPKTTLKFENVSSDMVAAIRRT
jgi:hypothetical protein